MRIYTLWASLREDIGPWMLVAKDEFSWEGYPDECEDEFRAARERCDESDWAYREITITVEDEAVYKCFESGEIVGTVEQP